MSETTDTEEGEKRTIALDPVAAHYQREMLRARRRADELESDALTLSAQLREATARLEAMGQALRQARGEGQKLEETDKPRQKKGKTDG